MSSSLTTVLNDVAEKFMKNNQKVEEADLKENVKQEIRRNNSVIGNELKNLKEQIEQLGGQVAKQQQQQPSPQMMPYPTNGNAYAWVMPQQMIPGTKYSTIVIHLKEIIKKKTQQKKVKKNLGKKHFNNNN